MNELERALLENPRLAAQGRKNIRNPLAQKMILEGGKFIFGETPSEMALNAAMGFGRLPFKLGAGALSLMTASDDASAGIVGRAGKAATNKIASIMDDITRELSTDNDNAERAAKLRRMVSQVNDDAAKLKKIHKSVFPKGAAVSPQEEARFMAQTISDRIKMNAGTKAALAGAGGLGLMAESDDAEAGVLGKALSEVSKAATKRAQKSVMTGDGGYTRPKKQTVDEAQRMAFPGIYDDPNTVLDNAMTKLAPESEALQRLFGVSRKDLVEIGKQRGAGTDFTLPSATGGKGAASAQGVMTRRNANRLVNLLGEAQSNPKYSGLVDGMTGWYVQDPMFRRMVELMGPEKAVQQYKQMNALSGMASAMSPVDAEIKRGTAAHWLANEGRFGDFMKYGGLNPEAKIAQGAPADLLSVSGHSAHKTAQAPAMQKYIDTGEVVMDSPKIPPYIQASGVPETGFQTNMPVGDAHWSRAVGLADTRNMTMVKGKPKIPGSSVSTPEMEQLGPWWQKQVAERAGLQSVPAQALAWGAYSPITGVKSLIGAPKLELMANQIMKTAKRLGVSPETARDLVLMGKTHAGFINPAAAAGAAGAGGLSVLAQKYLGSE